MACAIGLSVPSCWWVTCLHPLQCLISRSKELTLKATHADGWAWLISIDHDTWIHISSTSCSVLLACLAVDVISMCILTVPTNFFEWNVMTSRAIWSWFEECSDGCGGNPILETVLIKEASWDRAGCVEFFRKKGQKNYRSTSFLWRDIILLYSICFLLINDDMTILIPSHPVKLLNYLCVVV